MTILFVLKKTIIIICQTRSVFNIELYNTAQCNAVDRNSRIKIWYIHVIFFFYIIYMINNF